MAATGTEDYSDARSGDCSPTRYRPRYIPGVGGPAILASTTVLASCWQPGASTVDGKGYIGLWYEQGRMTRCRGE